MSKVIQIPFEISQDIIDRLRRGDYYVDIHGAIRNSSNNQYAAHPSMTEPRDSVTRRIIESATPEAASTASKPLPAGAKIGIVAGIVTVGCALAYGGYKLYTFWNKKKKEQSEKESDLSGKENAAYFPDLTDYLNGTFSKTMSLSKIRDALRFFDSYNAGEIKVEISDGEALLLRNIIVKYTLELCETNSYKIEGEPLLPKTPEKEKSVLLAEINRCLKAQEEVFSQDDSDTNACLEEVK